MKLPEEIQQVYIASEVADGILAKSIRSRMPAHVNIEVIDDYKAIQEHYQKSGRILEKDTLLVYPFPGRWISSCPGSDGMACCQYFVINFGVGCLYDCHYCYLQNFMNHPLMTLFGNLEDLFAEIDRKISGKKFHFRIGTGEYTDSLALEPVTGLSGILVNHFSSIENATLELKTKSSNVDSLLGLDHKGHTVIAWSVNPQYLIDEVEDDTASLEERLEAAKKAADAGYRLAFHFDPLIYYEEDGGWEKGYHDVIDQICDTVPTDLIAWISIGSFRYSPGQKEVMQKRWEEDRLTKEEMIQGPDGKYRYFKTIRERMYASVREKIQSRDEKLFHYLCMETRRMWENVYGFDPGSAKNLDSLFDRRRLYMDSLGLVPKPGRSAVGSTR